MDNQNDKFAGGFLAGTIFGSIVGGLLGAFLASKLSDAVPTEESLLEGKPPDRIARKRKSRQIRAATELSIEEARQGLEEKIAQLNNAIDDVRQQLSNVNGNAQE
jgi:gas vesicle protein